MKDYEVLKIENQLCFPLYVCSKEIIKIYKPYLDEIDLTYTQYITMMILWEVKEINVKSLGDRLYLDSGTLTPLLKKLEQKGYIYRIKSNTDERKLIISITEKGEKLKTKATSIPINVGKCLNLNEKESIQLYNLLYKVLNKINS